MTKEKDGYAQFVIRTKCALKTNANSKRKKMS